MLNEKLGAARTGRAWQRRRNAQDGDTGDGENAEGHVCDESETTLMDDGVEIGPALRF